MVCEAAVAVQPAYPAVPAVKAEAMQQQLEQQESPSSILHFNWDQRQTARAAMNTLVQALADDPVNNYFSGSKRVRFVKDEVKGYLKALPGATHFLATADSQAVALWQLMPHETPRNELLAGWTRILKVPPRLWRQLLRLELHYEKAHAQVASDFGDYYYLSFIGTAPEARGKGYGSLLLRCITERADREGRWCLLEATSERSQALYARHGFETYEAYRVSKAAPPVFLMKRPPVAAAAAVAAVAAGKGAGVLGPVALSAAALDLVAAVAAKVAGGPPSSSGPGSDCGSTASSAYISASVVIEDGSMGAGMCCSEKACCSSSAGGVCGEGCACLQEAKLGKLLDLAECPGLEEEAGAAAAAAEADGTEQAGAGSSSSNQQCETGSSKRAAAGGRIDGCAAE